MKRYLLVLFCLLSLTTVCFSANDGKVLLQYKPELGTALTYKMIIDGETLVAEGNNSTKTKMDTEMSMQQQTISKDKNENITMETEILSGKLVVNGKAQDLANVGSVVRVVMAPDGTVLSQTNLNSGDSNSNFMQIKFPKMPVGIGDTWTTRVEANSQIPVPMETVYTIIGFENYEGEECVKIRSKVNSKNESNKMILDINAEGNIYFCPTKGFMVANQVVSKMIMIGGNRKKPIKTEMCLKMKMDIIKKEIKKDIIKNNASLVENYDFENDPFFNGSGSSKESSTNAESVKETKSTSSLENLLKERKEKIQKNIKEESTTTNKVDETKEKERLKQLLKKFRKHEDKLEGNAFYRHPLFRQDGGREFYPYIGVSGGSTWLRVFIQYRAEDWLFVKTINAYTDFGSYKKEIQSSDLHREVISHGIVENADCSYDYDYQNIFENLAKSKKTATIRYIGAKYYKEKGIHQKERDAIAETLELKKLIDKYGINN